MEGRSPRKRETPKGESPPKRENPKDRDPKRERAPQREGKGVKEKEERRNHTMETNLDFSGNSNLRPLGVL